MPEKQILFIVNMIDLFRMFKESVVLESQLYFHFVIKSGMEKDWQSFVLLDNLKKSLLQLLSLMSWCICENRQRTGRIQSNEWEDKYLKKRYKLNVRIHFDSEVFDK